MCVQRFDDSLNSAIHIIYRISLRSSSMLEPRDPLLKVFAIVFFTLTALIEQILMGLWRALTGPKAGAGRAPGPAKATK